MSSSVSSSCSVLPVSHESVVRRPKVDGSNSSGFARGSNLLIPYYDDALKDWFKDLNAYLGYSAANLSCVCSKAQVLQQQFRFTHLFRAILSSQEFRHRLCKLEQPAIDHLNSKTTSLMNQARPLKQEIELLKETNSQECELQLQKERKLQHLTREHGKLVETYKKIGRCVERTLVDIFTQSFRFPDLKVFCLDDPIKQENKPPNFDRWVSRNVTPASEAIQLLPRLKQLVRRSINTLDFTGNLLFSRYFGDDRKTSKELVNILRVCCQGIPKNDWRIRHIIIDDKISGVGDLSIELTVGTVFFRNLLLNLKQSIERLNLCGLKSLNYNAFAAVLPMQLKELRVSSMLINDKIFPFFKGGLEILDIDWERACVDNVDDIEDENPPNFMESFLQVDDSLVSSALKKSCDTLQELRMTYATVIGRFLNEADLYNLQKLHLRYCKSLDENSLISFFTKADKLTDIDLSSTNTSGASLASIKGPVKKLNLRRCSHLDPNALEVFLQTIAQSLEVLQVDFAKIAGAFKSIPELPKLKEFSFSVGSFADKEEVQNIFSKCTKLDQESKKRLQEELNWLLNTDDGDVDMVD